METVFGNFKFSLQANFMGHDIYKVSTVDTGRVIAQGHKETCVFRAVTGLGLDLDFERGIGWCGPDWQQARATEKEMLAALGG